MVGMIEGERGGGWSGLNLLVNELATETGVKIGSRALQELSRRTLQDDGFNRSGKGGDLAASTARFASEYRKLATAAGDEEIGLELVESTVDDRGQEDVWKILDAVGSGRVDVAISRLRRLLDAASDPIAARLSFFALLAEFARHVTAVNGMMRMADQPRGVSNYGQFKAKIAPALQGDLEGDLPNPLAKLHPFRLHKAYLLASRTDSRDLDTWPWRLLETELQLKGESGEPEVALFRLLTELAIPR
jgi:DNA polymerase III delta subunit